MRTEGSNPERKRKTPLQKLASDSAEYHRLPRSREEDKDDSYIDYLEGKLGWKKSGAKTSIYGSGLADDGLDGVSVHFTVVLASSIQNFIRRATRGLG